MHAFVRSQQRNHTFLARHTLQFLIVCPHVWSTDSGTSYIAGGPSGRNQSAHYYYVIIILLVFTTLVTMNILF